MINVGTMRAWYASGSYYVYWTVTQILDPISEYPSGSYPLILGLSDFTLLNYFISIANSNDCAAGVVTVGKTGLLSAGIDGYLLTNLSESSNEDFLAFLPTSDGRLANMRVSMSSPPSFGKSIIFIIRKNNVDTSLSATISGTNTTGENLINSALFSGGDNITVKFTSDTGSTASNVIVAFEYIMDCITTPTSGSGTSINAGAYLVIPSSYAGYLMPDFTINTTELPIYLANSEGILKNFQTKVITAPGGSDVVSFTVRKNNSDTEITTTITGIATTASDIIHTETVSIGDLISIKVTTTAGSLAANAIVSISLEP